MHAAFAGIIDYAGLFPPASCTMARAVSSYDSYRGSADRWMLGRFIVAASRLTELGDVVRSGGFGTPDDPWRISAVFGANIPDEVRRVDAFRAEFEGDGLIVDAIEFKVSSVGQLLVVDQQLPRNVTRFLEVPMQGPYGQLVSAIGRIGSYAKIRTGGTSVELFPEPDEVVAFLIACTAHEVGFKATAGLHHAIRGAYPLTYDDDAAQGPMFGFINLLLAAAELVRGGDGEVAQEILEDNDRTAFVHAGGAITWRGVVYDADLLDAVRTRYFLSFGSCSFREPVDELQLERAT